jgi:acyl-CoA synthetase (AMP-forming)/AMP-acid ligase II
VRRVSVAGVDEVPTGATGKVRKAVLREQRFREPVVVQS